MISDNFDASGSRAASVGSQQARSSANPFAANISDLELDHYTMNHSNRGVAVIINNKNFQSTTKMGVRRGTDLDSDAMYKVFDMLKFERIETYTDLTTAEMEERLTEASKLNYRDSDCFACVILTHGEEGFLYGVDGKIAIEKLVKPFKGNNCTTLAGKPKLFFIQACRGDKLDCGATVSDAIGHGTSDDVDVRLIPAEADFLMAYSVAAGFYAWRNEVKGSWFIQAVADVFTKHCKTMDVVTMMTRVNKKVAYDYQSRSLKNEMNKKRQIPCLTSMLTKDLYFFKV